MTGFRHTALLQGRTTRVLKLAHGKGDSTLRGEIFHVDLDDNPKYSALSYVWGIELDPVGIECNGCQVEVTQNLAEALRYIRHESISISLWVDVLCINQRDVVEKNHQVALMKDIYASASEVLVWLGPREVEVATEVFEYITVTLASVVRAIDNYEDPEWLNSGQISPVLDKLALLLSSEYFTRTWIVQEVGLTNRALAHWGKSTIDFNEIGLIAMLYLNYFRPTLDSLGYLRDFERVANVYLSYLPLPGPQGLQDVLHRTRVNKATDPRDKVYAFISHPSARENASGFPYRGEDRPLEEELTDEDIQWRTLSVILAPDNVIWDFARLDHIGDRPFGPASPPAVAARRFFRRPGRSIKAPRYWPGPSFIKPDYNLSVVDVYLDFAMKMINRTKSLEVLSFVQHNAPLPPTGPDFPSWIPRWDICTDTSVLGRVICDHFAAANRRAIITPSPDPGSLIVRGLFFDRIALRTIPLTREDFTDPSRPSPVWTMSSHCRVSTYPIPHYPRIHVPAIPTMQDPDRLKAYRQTWTAGRVAATTDAPRDGFNPEPDFARYQLDYMVQQAQGKLKLEVDEMVRMLELKEEAKGGRGERYAEAAGRACHRRSFFITKAGFFGIGPDILEEEDSVVVLLGADVPFVIREKEKCGYRSDGYALIGECYVRGLMTGDTIRAWGGPDGDLTDITLR